MSKIDEAIAVLADAQEMDSFYVGGDRVGVRRCIEKALKMLREPVPKSIDDATPAESDKVIRNTAAAPTTVTTLKSRVEALERKVEAMEAGQ